MKVGTEPPGDGRYTVSRSTNGEGKYVDYDLDKYAHVRIVLSPDEEEGNRFEWRAPKHDLPLSFMKEACRAGASAALRDPIPGGGRLARVCVSVVGGSYHERDTDESSVRIATMRAVRDALARATLIRI